MAVNLLPSKQPCLHTVDGPYSNSPAHGEFQVGPGLALQLVIRYTLFILKVENRGQYKA